MNPDQEKFREVEDIFHLVSELPGEARAAALEQACHGDPALRREVESLLAHADPATSPLQLTRTLRGCLAEPACDANIGRRIGPYELRSALGSGGMANVYLALQAEPIQRVVAVKLIKRGLDTDETIRRFQNERQVLAGLKHPSITQLLDAGSTDDHLPYFVMEHVTGEPITRYCERHKLTTRQRLELFQKVCSAVHFAHQNAVIHRDLKPAHILVTPDGSPKLLDFGISKLLQPDPGGLSQATRSEERFMTFEYASPEQINGQAITTASDIYSLGVVLYELLTGVRPSPHADRSGQPPHPDTPDPPKPSDAVARLARGLAHEDRPGHRSRPAARPHQLRKELRGDLDNIVMTALRREPHLRYLSAEHFAADIERHLRHEPVLAAPPALTYRVIKFARRNRALVALMIALLVGAAGSTGGAVWALRARNAARLSEVSARHHAEQMRRALCIRDVTLASMHHASGLIGNMKTRLAAVPPDLRGWEWGYLNSLADNSLETWRGHEAEVRALAASPDGTAVASGGMDRTIRIWDPRSGRTVRLLSGHQGRITSLAYTPDAQSLLSAGMDGAARLWNPRTGELIRVVRETGPGIVSAKFSPDGRWLSLGSADRFVTIYDASSFAEARKLEGFGGTFNTVAFTADGRQIAVGSHMPVIRLWDVQTGAMVRKFEGLAGQVCSIAFSPDGNWMATAICDRKATLTDLSTGRARALGGKMPAVGMVAFSPDGRRLVCSGIGNTALRMWRDGRELGEYRGHEKLALPVVFSPDGRRIISGSDDGTIKLWEADPVPAFSVFNEHRGQIAKAEFLANGGVLVSVGAMDGFLYLWDVEGRGLIRRFSPHPTGVRGLAVSPDESLLATCGVDGNLRAYESSTASLVWRARVGKEPTLCLAFSPDGSQIVTGSQDGTIRLWNARGGELIRSWSRPETTVNAVQFTGGKVVVTAASDGQVTLWDAVTGFAKRNLPAHKGAATSMAVAPGGSFFVSGGHDGTIRVWNAADGQPLQTISAHEGDVLSLAFSPDGRRLVSGGGDLAAKLWDAETWSEILSIRKSDAPVHTAGFSRDGRLLTTGDRDGRLSVLDSASNAVQFPSRQDLASRNARAAEAIEQGALQADDWPSLAAVIRASPTLPEAVKRRAFVQILSRAGEGLPLTTDWQVTYLTLPPTVGTAPDLQAWSAAPRLPGGVVRAVRFDWDTRSPAPGIPEDRFGLIADATITLPAGSYRLTTRSDDGVRVWVDDRKVIDDWACHPVQEVSAEVPLTAGPHRVRIEYFEDHGQASLWLGFTRGGGPSSRAASETSPAGT